MRAIVSEKGQVTIPKPIRDRMGLKKGQALEFQAKNGEIIATKVRNRGPLESVYGILNRPMSTDRYIDKIRGKAKLP